MRDEDLHRRARQLRCSLARRSGQGRRIGIERALYHRPQVLVFDEATSALDVHTERHVYAELAALAKTHTIITVAHRLDAVTNSDRVVVLEHGRIVDQGQPEDVLACYREGTLTV